MENKDSTVNKIKKNILDYHNFADDVWTRDKFTEEFYKKRFINLENNFGEKVDEYNKFIFINNLIQISKNKFWSLKYVRSMIGIIKYNFELRNLLDDEVKKLLKTWKGNKDCPKRTTALRKNNAKPEDIKFLANYFLNLKNDIWGQRTWNFCLSMLFTGIRPCEWKDIDILSISQMANLLQMDKNDCAEELGIWLKVKNAKNSNGRTHGDFRYLFIGLLKNVEYTLEERRDILTQINVIQTHIQEISSFHKQILENDINDPTFLEKYKNHPKSWFSYYQHMCTQKLMTARNYRYKLDLIEYEKNKYYKNGKIKKSKEITKKYISLYSFRHQFSANLKSINTNKGEIAYLMGHKSLYTADLCYAGIRHSYSNLKPNTSLKIPQKIENQLKNYKNHILNVNTDFNLVSSNSSNNSIKFNVGEK